MIIYKLLIDINFFEKAVEYRTFYQYNILISNATLLQKENKVGNINQAENKEKNTKKNIIFYFTDQQRADTFNSDVMPYLSEYSEDGAVFSNCYTCQPVCGPARACLQTGVYATECSCFKNGQSLPADIPHLADYFNDAGYDTAYIGKWHLATDKDYMCEKSAVPKERRGGYKYWRAADVLEFTSDGQGGVVFDEDGNAVEFSGYRPDCINDFALEYLSQRDESKPFFMFISQLEPHHQNNKKSYEGYPDTVGNFKNYTIPEDLSFLKGDYNEHYANYLSAINRIDYNIKLLVEKLKAMGIYEDTVIVFTSDHGCHFKTRNLEYKRSCHDSSIHIPLAVFGGGINCACKDDRLVSLIDLPATLLSIAGIKVPEHFKGNDLFEEISRDAVYVQISESECARSIRTKDYKYSVAVPTYIAGVALQSSPIYMEEYLYDLNSDPYEKHNLIKDPSYKCVRKTLKEILLREMNNAGEKTAKILPAIISKKK